MSGKLLPTVKEAIGKVLNDSTLLHKSLKPVEDYLKHTFKQKKLLVSGLSACDIMNSVIHDLPELDEFGRCVVHLDAKVHLHRNLWSEDARKRKCAEEMLTSEATLALVFDRANFWHYIIYDVPPSLKESFQNSSKLPDYLQKVEENEELKSLIKKLSDNIYLLHGAVFLDSGYNPKKASECMSKAFQTVWGETEQKIRNAPEWMFYDKFPEAKVTLAIDDNLHKVEVLHKEQKYTESGATRRDAFEKLISSFEIFEVKATVM